VCADHHAADFAALVQRALRVPTMEVLSYAEARQRFERDYWSGCLKLTDGNAATRRGWPTATAPEF